ncbi:MAG: hypothetical protein HW388_1197 [Dehalococcoidia bacterium]|nr:hypothetical protein [Dehalococcoidia bacterium]
MSSVGSSISEHDREFDLVHWARSGEALQTLTYKNEVSILKKAAKMMSAMPKGGENVD